MHAISSKSSREYLLQSIPDEEKEQMLSESVLIEVGKWWIVHHRGN